jgi:cytochrome P450
MSSDTDQYVGSAGGDGEMAERESVDRDGAGGGVDAADVASFPLPPYPPNLGSPKLHVFRQMRDPMGFVFDTLATRDVVRIHFLGMGDLYSVGHPEHSKRILLTERDRFRKTDDFSIAFGEGLLTVEGEDWRQQRDVLQPLFVRESVRGYADGMVEQVRRRVERWEDGQRLDLQREVTNTTLDVLFATVLGRELELDGDHAIREAAEHLHDWFRSTSWFLPNWVPTPARRRFEAAKSTLEAEADRLLAEKRREGARTDPSEATDLLSLLVGLRGAGVADSGMLTDERLRDQMVTMIFAGHDTTTTTLSFAFYLLAHHGEVRERFHEEVDTLSGPPTMADVDDLPVTERIVTETLRLFPPVHTLPRLAAEDVAFDGYRVPAGERVHIPVLRIQRDPRFFDDPGEFRPERWSPAFRQSLHNFAYAPFGAGPRICIGREFALMEAKLALATVGRQYELYHLGDDGPEDPPIELQMTTRMREGEQFLVTER